MGYISEVNLNGQTHKVGSSLYGTCGTTASTATKVVALADYSTLTVGTTIRVKFSYSNSVANPKLNVNGLGAIPIYKYGTTTPGVSSELSWNAGAVVSFTYDGTAWMMNDWNDMSASIASVADGLAILATGDTHASITSGQFVYVRNHGSAEGFSGNAILADGLYVAQANISANGALTTSNLTADGSGGLNALKSEVDSLNSKFTITALAKIEFQYGGGSWVQRIIFDLNGTNKSMLEINMGNIIYSTTDDGGVNWTVMWTK